MDSNKNFKVQTTLLALVVAIGEDLAMRMISAGRVQLTGNFRGNEAAVLMED